MKYTLFMLLLSLSSTVYATSCDECDDDEYYEYYDKNECKRYYKLHSDEPYYLHNAYGIRFLIEPRYLYP